MMCYNGSKQEVDNLFGVKYLCKGTRGRGLYAVRVQTQNKTNQTYKYLYEGNYLELAELVAGKAKSLMESGGIKAVLYWCEYDKERWLRANWLLRKQ